VAYLLSYDAEELLGIQQQKWLDHPKENIHEVLERKVGRAAAWG
jgi:ribosome assembly protein YihI (activator of Der GTPase)